MSWANASGQDKGGDGTLSFFKAFKVVSDIFQPIIPSQCYSVYSVLARRENLTLNPDNSLRELARAANVSKAAASRAIEVLVHVGLVERVRIGGSQPDQYKLPNAWEAAKRWGAIYLSKSVSFSLAPESAKRLRASVKGLRAKQRGTITTSRVDSGVSPGGHQRSIRKRQRATRETQTRTHLIREEVRSEEVPTPAPPRSHDSETENDKDSPDEDEPDGLLKWARAKFTGVMNELGDYFFDTSQPPMPHLANGAAEWEDFDFGSLAVDAVVWDGETLALTLGADDPATAQLGLQKYQKRWEAALSKWYVCKVRCEIQRTTRTWLKTGSEVKAAES